MIGAIQNMGAVEVEMDVRKTIMKRKRKDPGIP